MFPYTTPFILFPVSIITRHTKYLICYKVFPSPVTLHNRFYQIFGYIRIISEPNSSSVDALSKALGSRTVLSGSVSRGKNDPSQSLQMIERPLMTPDELKSMPKGQFVVMKTGCYPMKVRLKLFFHWGIQFGEVYTAPERGNRKVAYADKAELVEAILAKYPPTPVTKQQKRAGHGNPSWEEATGKKSSLPERRSLRTAPPGEDQERE